MIGALKHQVDRLEGAFSDDGGGGVATTFTVRETVWAGVERLTSTRNFAGDKRQRLRRLAVTIRFVADVDLGDRIRFQNADYEVVSIEDGDTKDRRLTLICEEALS